MRVRLTSRAYLDIRQQIDWLTERSPQSGTQAVRRIFDTLGQLGTYPLAGRVIANGDREVGVRFGRHGFVIRYQPRRDEVIVLRVFHGAQNRG